MAMVDARTWLQYLSLNECWEILGAESVGRIGVTVDSAPEIYPVNFVVHQRTIVFRTDSGNKLRGLDRSPSVCFEVDGFDNLEHTGWSVLVKGKAEEVTDAADLRVMAALDLTYWLPGHKPHWIRIRPTEVSGRRIDRPTGVRSTR